MIFRIAISGLVGIAVAASVIAYEDSPSESTGQNSDKQKEDQAWMRMIGVLLVTFIGVAILNLWFAYPWIVEQQQVEDIGKYAATGVILWNEEAIPWSGETIKHVKNGYASPTPIVANDRVYVHFGPTATACLDMGARCCGARRSLPTKYATVAGDLPCCMTAS